MKLINISIQDDFLPSRGADISDGSAKIENHLLLIKFSEQHINPGKRQITLPLFFAQNYSFYINCPPARSIFGNSASNYGRSAWHSPLSPDYQKPHRQYQTQGLPSFQRRHGIHPCQEGSDWDSYTSRLDAFCSGIRKGYHRTKHYHLRSCRGHEVYSFPESVHRYGRS